MILNKQQIANALRLSDNTIDKYLKLGMPFIYENIRNINRNKRKLKSFDLDKVVKWIKQMKTGRKIVLFQKTYHKEEKPKEIFCMAEIVDFLICITEHYQKVAKSDFSLAEKGSPAHIQYYGVLIQSRDALKWLKSLKRK